RSSRSITLMWPPGFGVCARAGPTEENAKAPRAVHTATANRNDAIVIPPLHAGRLRPGGSSLGREDSGRLREAPRHPRIYAKGRALSTAPRALGAYAARQPGSQRSELRLRTRISRVTHRPWRRSWVTCTTSPAKRSPREMG